MSCYSVLLQTPRSSEDSHSTRGISRNHSIFSISLNTFLPFSVCLALCLLCLLGLILTYSLFGSSVPANIYPQREEILECSPHLEGSSPSTVALALLKPSSHIHILDRRASVMASACCLMDSTFCWRWSITKLSLQ